MISKYTRIKRTIKTLMCAYPLQQISKETVLNRLNDADFQTIYINY